jgi:hypothetical protein
VKLDVSSRVSRCSTRATNFASPEEGRRSADRRTSHGPRRASRMSPFAWLPARQRLLSRAARLSALRRGTRQGERIRRWLSSSFPRFLRPGSTSVTRCRLSRVYRARRRPVVVPAERWPRAARQQGLDCREAAPSIAVSQQRLRPFGTPSRTCAHPKRSAHGLRLGMNASTASKSSACTKPVIIRCATLSDRAPTHGKSRGFDRQRVLTLFRLPGQRGELLYFDLANG